jgi:endonuclease YncB( thermonuclease family)
MARKPRHFVDFPVSYGDAQEVGVCRAVCEHVVDGDTADFFLDVGWYQHAYVPVRFRDIDTAEIRGTSGEVRELAMAAYRRTEELVLNQPVLVRSFKQKTTFERFVGDVFFADRDGSFPGALTLTIGSIQWRLISDVLVAEGLATRV